VAGFRAAYGASAAVVGDYTNALAPGGGTIQLLRPLGGTEEVVDHVTFSANTPWPLLADGVDRRCN